MRGDKRIPEKEITVLSELLTVQLLKLDSIEADGEAKTQRRIENLTLDLHREKPENRATDETTKEELFEKHQKLKLGLSLLKKELAGKKKGATVMKNGEVLQLLVNGEKVVRRSSSYQDSESAAFAGKIRVSGDEMGPDLSLLVNKQGC